MEKKNKETYMKGFIPYMTAAFLVGLVGGFAAVLGPAFVKDMGLSYNNATWTALATAMSTAACAPVLGKLDISMYRDDIGNRKRLPAIRETEIPFDVNGSSIILVDDVLSTGRTIRAALDALTDYGRAGSIRLAVLVDRGNIEFPIRADYVGMKSTPPEDQKIVVRFEADGDPGIYAVKWEN